ncbi:hypothetical protein PRK78_001226 [Emydomyces testavorans]|uniref:Phytochrome n=1 Tax=Emydomyces testavorans TaxID=2070801 RepID=A0AAF0DCK3_9EURO|nr:hypothetical protein PRK78_001226 [Emydomyces testavorans]
MSQTDPGKNDAADASGPSSPLNVESAATPDQAVRSPSSRSPDDSSTDRTEQPFGASSRSGSFQFGPENVARVFPIRSVVSVAPSTIGQPNSAQISDNKPRSPNEGQAGQYLAINVETEVQDQLQLQTQVEQDAELRKNQAVDDAADSLSHAAVSKADNNISQNQSKDEHNDLPAGDNIQENTISQDDMQEHQHVTTRFRHIVTDKGHAVITGRDDGVLQHCEDEPIHIPGAVQSFGVMLALRQESDGRLVVRVASENSQRILGYSPNDLFSLDNFCTLLGDDQADILLDHLDFIQDDTWDPSIDGPEVFILSIIQPAGPPGRFWCAIHFNKAKPDLVICEFELEIDHIHPLNVAGETMPLTPARTLGLDPSPDEVEASTVNISQPLRILRNARRRRGEAAAMEVFSILSRVQEQLSKAESLDVLLNRTTGLIKELTGFHRVMIYQFDPSWNGMVVAELVDPKASKDLYKGLRFPASDIPKQARDLYKINKVRLLYDRDLVTARLVCRTVEDLATPVDMTHSYLRAMSPIHIKYLANMAVRASMSISIIAFNELWGLISCHSYGDLGMRVSFPIRKMCRLISSAVSRNIERLSYASRLQARKLINTVPTEENPRGYIVASSDDLLKLFEADYGAVSIGDETKILGKPADSQEVLALVEYLRMRQFTFVAASNCITKEFPDLRYPPGFKHVAGLLYVPLSAGGSDFIVYFRRAKVTEVKWGGNPYEKQIKEGTLNYLEPRKSFQTWREIVLNQSREWTDTDMDTAAVLCLVYGKFIKVWRQKEAAMEKSHLTKLLLANSAHEVRTPLNAIINYLEIALENSLDHETRENLVRSHSASKSLIYVINDLLDLTNTERGRTLIKDESFDFHITIKEATKMFEVEAKRKGIAYVVTVHPGVPKFVLGDQRRVRQVIVSLISNAIKHTMSGSVTVDFWRSLVLPEPGNTCVEMTVLDTGTGMSQATLDVLFHDLEQVSIDNDDCLTDEEEEQEGLRVISDNGKVPGKRVLGLGLALVARIVRNLNGQLSVKSEEGKGSRFKIFLQFPIPEKELVIADELCVANTSTPSTPLITEGEFMLVKSNSATWSAGRRHSTDSSRSGGSSRNRKGEADRLITAMQEPPLDDRKISEETNSRSLRPSGHESTCRSVHSDPALGVFKGPVRALGRRVSNGCLPKVRTPSLTPFNLPAQPVQEAETDSGGSTDALKTSEQGLEKPSSPDGHPRLAQEPSPVRPSASVIQPQIPLDVPRKSETTLNVLVAEDDPINSKIVKKRLEKSGHNVHLTINGEECATAYRTDPASFDVVLMDIQMPLVDGMESTAMIREFENTDSNITVSETRKSNGRIPVFAVSASLVEKDLKKYIDTGFDGWIMKPIDFNQLNLILTGIQQVDVRARVTYGPGMWEKGGWFARSKKLSHEATDS